MRLLIKVEVIELMYLKILDNSIYENWPMLAIFLITMITIRVFYLIHHHRKSAFYKEILNILSIIYILLLFQLLTDSEANVGGGYNIMPLTEMTRYTFGSNLFMLNVVGNIIAFIPFGFLISNYLKSKHFLSPMIITIIVSASVEFIQLAIGRSFDVDDIILNVVGSIIGYLLYIGALAIKKHLPKIFQKDGLYNIICIIIIAGILVYLLKLAGVF